MQRDENGKLPAYDWPGGYPIIYFTADGGILCPGCANGENGSLANDPDDDPQWTIVGDSILWEGPGNYCDHCGVLIESAYGDPDSEDDDALQETD